MNQDQNKQVPNVGNNNQTVTNIAPVANVNQQSPVQPSPVTPATTPLTPKIEQPSNILAGSPGVIVAPVSSEPTDASSKDKGRVNGVVKEATEIEQTLSQTTRINPTVVAPRVDVGARKTEPPLIEEEPAPVAPPPKKSHKAGVFIFLLLLIIGGLGYYIYQDYEKDLAKGECSPLVASDDTLRDLDINSSVVQELYDKVKTNIREDVAYHNFDDTFKLYLAYRQIPTSDIYESNCNLFNEGTMSNFTCASATSFTPTAFKEETLAREVRKLFGESITIPNQNITLGSSCFGGYQYVAERGEYVQGYCGQIPTTTYNAEKKIVSATVQGDTITLREDVRYYSAEGITSDQLQSGIYVHTFKLDNSYHYAYVNRTMETT